MMALRPAELPRAAAIKRLNALSPLDDRAFAALHAAVVRPRRFRAKREMLCEGQEITETLLILDGWAARQRILEDGRRQIIDFLLPGDLIGSCHYDRPVAFSSIIALTDVEACIAPDRSVSRALSRAYALSSALGEAHLAAQVTRLGRMNANDRIADLLLEMLERLEAAGVAGNGRCTIPLTQEIIADAVGLTPVHVNRTLQALRKQGAIKLTARELTFANPDGLRRSIGRGVTRITVV